MSFIAIITNIVLLLHFIHVHSKQSNLIAFFSSFFCKPYALKTLV